MLNMKINSIREENCYGKLSKGDIKVVMDRLGISFELDSNEVVEVSMGADEFAEMFDKEEPSLEEVKEAFDIFDENKDGFIDATELQRALRCLGVKGRLVQMEECTRMIKIADEDEDGRINFNDFLKFMDNCFC
ncbi:hypothetical protein CRYUN_Cryun29cG0098900 [Craigia yunnanensis]